ncbi:hypothetical protein [Alloyangia pacifica]|uniref:hypothetical protein n=1 Tax=Alloyangia pacifica TaxID=311180 RepID=UPI000B8121B8|nr:hypothetical protein [Alloyangia pacifica]
MSELDRIHSLELKTQSIEDKFKGWRTSILAIIAFLGAGTALGIYDLYGRALDEVQLGVAKAAASEISTLRDTAELNAAAINSALIKSCFDKRFTEKTEMCIFQILPEGKYTLNYGAASASCAARGARLCTLNELTSAYEKGIEQCAWGWVSDVEVHASVTDLTGTVAYPMQVERQGCLQGMNVQNGQNLATVTRGAWCCM